MVDNLKLILPLLKFQEEGDFYYLQILQRKKENPEIGNNSRVIKNYYIKSEQYLLDRYEEIKKLCEFFNARAMIRLNKRNQEKIAYKTLEVYANTMANKEFWHISKSYDRACGLTHSDSNKTWIVDLDGKFTYEEIAYLESFINQQNPEGKKIICYIHSKNGLHLITKPFDKSSFIKNFPEIEIHKDNPTNLYIPN